MAHVLLSILVILLGTHDRVDSAPYLALILLMLWTTTMIGLDARGVGVGVVKVDTFVL